MPDLESQVVLDRLKEIEQGNLTGTHELYNKYYDEWLFLDAAYEGIKALKSYGAFQKHERESPVNFDRRMKELYGYTYSRSIVDLLNAYLFKKEYPRTIPGPLSSNPLWEGFMDDSNLYGLEFDEFFIDQGRIASTLGFVGILVDMPRMKAENMKEQKDKVIYPYMAAYKPTHILDWIYERIDGKRKLTYLKIKDDDDYYRVWTLERWFIYRLEEPPQGSTSIQRIDKDKSKVKAKERVGQVVVEVDKDFHDLGEIPFVWLFNQRSNIDPEIGLSDITDISRIDISIIRNLSQIEEIINYTAYPMMRKPMKEQKGGKATSTDQKDEIGASAILEFDPEHPESKPDWLEAQCEGPIGAIINVISSKVSEIYRASNVGGMASTEISTSAKSGVALKTEFQLLNSKLVKKGKNVVKAKRRVVYFWLKWMNILEQFIDEIKFDYIKSFEMQDIMTDLENLLTARAIVTDSLTFDHKSQKLAARMVVAPDEEEILADIDQEIDEAEPFEDLTQDFFTENGQIKPEFLAGQNQNQQSAGNQPPVQQ